METCRLCLSKSSKLSSILKYKEILIKIVPELPLIEKSDELSKTICKICIDILLKAEKLRKYSIKNDNAQRLIQLDTKQKFKEEYVDLVSEDNDSSSFISCIKSISKTSDTEFDNYESFEEITTNTQMTCDLCEQQGIKKNFKLKLRLIKHMENDHLKLEKGASKYPCTQCSSSFSKKFQLQDHLKRIHSALKCDICDMDFENRKDLNLHNYLHCDYLVEYKEEIKFECILCPFSTRNKNELNNHIPCHLRDFETDERPLICLNCSKIIEDYDTLQSHSEVHNEKVTHQCLKCNKKFVLGIKLLEHLKKHFDRERNACPYENCSFAPKARSDLENHIKYKHEKITMHLCQICGKSFAANAFLQSHVRNIHENKNKGLFKCRFCPMTFRIASQLRNHQSVHTIEYNFKCDYPGCTKSFKAKRNLLTHAKFHDPSKLNFKHACLFDGCDKKFLTKDALNRHKLTHTKAKPFECTFEGCDRAFSQSNDLNKHLRQHYGHDRIYHCSYTNCVQSFRLKTELRYHESLHYRN